MGVARDGDQTIIADRLLPFSLCSTSTPMILHFSTKPGVVAASWAYL
jgi:hypothetical protein